MQQQHTDGVGAVYVQTNEPDNRVIAYRRSADGRLDEIGSIATGGKGDGSPHLTSQGSVVTSADDRWLYVTNAASDDVSVFDLSGDAPALVGTVASGGSAPKSVAEHAGSVYVLNAGTPSVQGFRMSGGRLQAIEGSTRDLSAPNADPAQIGFTPDGSTLIATERGTDSIVSYAVGADGMLGMPMTVPSSGPTPYGFAVSGRGALVVTEAFRAEKGAAAASSYRVAGTEVAPVTMSVGNGRSEICWAVITPDDRFAFTTNFADGAVSRYAIGGEGALTLEDAAAGVSIEGETGLRDEDLSADGRFLYAIDADHGHIVGWAVREGGALEAIGTWGELPATVAGLAAR